MGWATIGLIIPHEIIAENDCQLIIKYINKVTGLFIDSFDRDLTVSPKELKWIISQTKKGTSIEKICDNWGIRIPEQPLCDGFKIPKFTLHNNTINFEVIVPIDRYLKNPSIVPMIINNKIFPYDETIQDIDDLKLTSDYMITMLELHTEDYIIKLQYKI